MPISVWRHSFDHLVIIRPPFGERVKAATSLSISSALAILTWDDLYPHRGCHGVDYAGLTNPGRVGRMAARGGRLARSLCPCARRSRSVIPNMARQAS